ncbi:MAG: COR domain-containing protein [Chloroflexota bacterium]
MRRYKYDNPDDAYKEAVRRIKRAKGSFLTRRSDELDLGGLGLTAVPPEIAELTHLTRLNISTNKLTAIPAEIGNLTQLGMLFLHNNGLTALPPEVRKLTQLAVLFLYNNGLTAFPPEIGKLTQLDELDLSNNKLTIIPSEIGKLTQMVMLNLASNHLTAILPEITRLTKLEYLNLRNNPELPIPPEILEQWSNPQAILDYLREQKKAIARPLNEAKLIFVGQGGVGKTSLVKGLLGQDFDAAESQTEGINIESWSLAVERRQQGLVYVALNIWDFGGQEIMHATHQFFLTKRSLYLLVLDGRQGEDEGRVEYWLALINSFAPDAPVLIVINKSDQHHLDINRRGLQQKYPAIKGFIRTSAHTGHGLERLKTEMATLLGTMKHVDSPFPASWMAVKQTLTKMQAAQDYIPYTEYQQLCQENGVSEASSQQTLIRFLHDLGVILNFDDDRVQDTNVLNANWITRGIYSLLNNPSLQKSHGLLRHTQLGKLLPAAAFPGPTQHRFLREMMFKFELAFELPDRKRLLIPDLLSKEQPDFVWNDTDALHFAYQYRVLPHSILHRFMVRQHQRMDPNIRWHTGVLLHDGDFTALVTADIEAATIRIGIIGTGDRRRFLYSLRLEFASIHNTISGTKPQEVVPIPSHPTAPPVSYTYLEKLETMEIMTTTHAAQNGEVIMLDVAELLNGVSTVAMRQAGLPSRSEILATLRDAFSQGEFYGLLFELSINKNDIGGEAPADQMREFVSYMERQNRLGELVELMGKKRPFHNPR